MKFARFPVWRTSHLKCQPFYSSFQALRAERDGTPEDLRELLTNCTYLEDSSVSMYGYKIYGSPWTPTYGNNWGFNLDRGEEIKSRHESKDVAFERRKMFFFFSLFLRKVGIHPFGHWHPSDPRATFGMLGHVSESGPRRMRGSSRDRRGESQADVSHLRTHSRRWVVQVELLFHVSAKKESLKLPSLKSASSKKLGLEPWNNFKRGNSGFVFLWSHCQSVN